MNWHRAQRLRSEKIASNARRMELFLVLYLAYPPKLADSPPVLTMLPNFYCGQSEAIHNLLIKKINNLTAYR